MTELFRSHRSRELTNSSAWVTTCVGATRAMSAFCERLAGYPFTNDYHLRMVTPPGLPSIEMPTVCQICHQAFARESDDPIHPFDAIKVKKGGGQIRGRGFAPPRETMKASQVDCMASRSCHQLPRLVPGRALKLHFGSRKVGPSSKKHQSLPRAPFSR